LMYLSDVSIQMLACDLEFTGNLLDFGLKVCQNTPLFDSPIPDMCDYIWLFCTF